MSARRETGRIGEALPGAESDAVTAFAHSRPGKPQEQWHKLEDHLLDVADLASAFAGKWGAADWGYHAGLWHDLGKYACDFQSYLASFADEVSPQEIVESDSAGRRRGPDHSSAGAIHARSAFDARTARAFEFVIAGHHAGLPDHQNLLDRLRDPEKRARYDRLIGAAAGAVTSGDAPDYPQWLLNATGERGQRCFETFVRMLYSALVDADFLDTERAVTGAGREPWKPISEYWPPLETYLEKKREVLGGSAAVHQRRQEVLRWCIEAGAGARGAYTLTVPTGGGKTLSSMAFALRHATRHGLDRVVVAVPFLTIIDQTVDVFREIFEESLGAPALIEHHSNLDPADENARTRMASENWDAPLVVTTQVQLFESLFANRSSRCRKLHNLSNSVVILDEVQTIPAPLLEPILDQLNELVAHYGTTVLMTTATQPSLQTRSVGPRPFRGFDPAPREIVPHQHLQSLFEDLRRVSVQWPGESPVAWSDLAAELSVHQQVLAIVDLRRDAADVWTELNAIVPGALHLSALMCAAHRRQVLADIRRRLATGEECRVISTQLVEAGVDVDFPVVFRAMAGLESLAQAAGRCNREGARSAAGDFRIFRSPTSPPPVIAHHREVAQVMLNGDPDLDLFSPHTFAKYFDRLYANRADLDVKGIQVMRQAWNYEQTAASFEMIPEATTTVYVPFGAEGRAAADALRYGGPSRSTFRRLQSFGIAVYPHHLGHLRAAGAVELLHDAAWVLIWNEAYDPALGLRLPPEAGAIIV